MTAPALRFIRNSNSLSYCLAGLLAVTGIAAAQEPDSTNNQPHAWRRAADAPDQTPQNFPDRGAAPDYSPQAVNQGPPPPPNYSANQNYPQGQQPNQPYPATQQAQPYPASYPAPSIPATLTIRPGTYLSVRVDQWLSSDRNQQGDTFFASLAEPLVVDGIVVAQRGQTVRGRVTEAQKAGRVEGTSKLGIELTGLTLVDGQQVNIQSQMVTRNGTTSVGRDAAGVGTTTALGAIIGAGAGDGRGAAIGAGAGAAAGLIGVLLTRGKPTVIYPETMLTFQLGAPVNIATDRAPLAFRYAEQGDYGHGGYARGPAPQPVGPAPLPLYRPYYSPYSYPYYWGPGFSVYVGPRFSYGGYYYGGYRGFRR